MSSVEEILGTIKGMRAQLKGLQKSLKAVLKGDMVVLKGGKAPKVKAVSGEEKPKRPLNVWQCWTQHVKICYTAEYATFKATCETKQGVAIKFAKHCSVEMAADYSAFTEDFKASLTKVKTVAAVAVMPVVAVAAATSPPSTPKVKAPAPTPSAPRKEESDESSDDEGTARPWTWKGTKYYRTTENECWLLAAGGAMGKWSGVYDPIADSMDADAEEPAVETD